MSFVSARPRLPLLALLGAALLLFVLSPPPARAQVDGLTQIGSEMDHFLAKQRTRGLLPNAVLVHQPLSAYEAQRYLDSLDLRRDGLSAGDRLRLDRLRGLRDRPGTRTAQRLWGALYQNGQDFLSVRAPDDAFAFQLNPLFYGSLGYLAPSASGSARYDALPADGYVTWRNTRGVRASGHIGPTIFFETRLEENQRRPLPYLGYAALDEGLLARPFAPTYIDTANTAPRLDDVDLNRDEVYDYFVAMGVVGARTRFFEIRFGRDRNRWGHGANSLFLSDFAINYDQLQIRTNVWRFEYVNLFTRFSDAVTERDGNDVRPSRYGALHMLALNVSPRVQLTFFEEVIFGADEVGERRDAFEVGYLNPVIFYRALESAYGSPDNVLIGAGAAWIVTPGVRLYGQFLLDELRVQEIGNQWWGNKWGALGGVHLAGVGLPALEVRAEVARLRPYLYSHRTFTTTPMNFADPLGHVTGANAYDASLHLAYRPAGRVQAALNAAYTVRGRNDILADGTLVNFGGDPRIPYNDVAGTVRNEARESNRDVEMLQGIRQSLLLLEAEVSLEVVPNLFATGALYVEQVDDDELGTARFLAPVAALRWGLPFRSQRY